MIVRLVLTIVMLAFGFQAVAQEAASETEGASVAATATVEELLQQAEEMDKLIEQEAVGAGELSVPNSGLVCCYVCGLNGNGACRYRRMNESSCRSIGGAVASDSSC